MRGIVIKAGLFIPDSELEESFIRSSGPGGQNVNKVSSAVQLRFNVLASASLTDVAREALLRIAAAKHRARGTPRAARCWRAIASIS